MQCTSMGIFVLLSPAGSRCDRFTARPVSELFPLPRPVMADKRCFNRQRCRKRGGILSLDRIRPSRCSSWHSWLCCSSSSSDRHHWHRCCNCRTESPLPGTAPSRSPVVLCAAIRLCCCCLRGTAGGVAPCGAPPDPPAGGYTATPTGGKRSKAEPRPQ